MLLTLVENSGHTVDKETLMASVWADSFVEEGSLNRNISTLRKVLGEDSHSPRLVKTVPKRGYRFEGAVREIIVDDEEVTVERRTKYSLAYQKRQASQIRRTRLPLLAAAIVVGLAAIGGWTAWRTSGGEANHVAASSFRGTDDADAYALYERGRALWRNRSVEGLHYATQDLEQAIRLDPSFALAHAALADAYAFDVTLWKKAEARAIEALRLDPGLAGPHATIGFVRTFWEWRLAEAEEHFRSAIELDPDYATAHQWYSINLIMRQNIGSSLAEIKRAVQLDPTSVAINGDLCQILYLSLKYDQAIEQCQKTLEIDPNYLPAYQHLYAIYAAKEMYPEAVDAYFRYEELNTTTQSKPAELNKLRKAYAAGGIRSFWREGMNASAASPYQRAQYELQLGNVDGAYRWFSIAAERRSFEFLFFTADPANYALFREARFRELARLLNNCLPTQDPQNQHPTCSQ